MPTKKRSAAAKKTTRARRPSAIKSRRSTLANGNVKTKRSGASSTTGTRTGVASRRASSNRSAGLIKRAVNAVMR